MESVTINIQGMTCGGCVKSVTDVLQKISGIASVDVSLARNHANINYDPAKCQPSHFISAIEDAGFDVV